MSPEATDRRQRAELLDETLAIMELAWVDEQLRPLAAAGATWWIESRWEAPNDPATLLARVRQGPPRI